MSNNLLLTGYVTVRKFGGYALPVPMKNKLLRAYAFENQFTYKLPLVETCILDNYMYLFDTIESCKNSSDIAMCSIYMFPKDANKFELLYSKISKKKLRFHFIFENSVISSDDIEEFYMNSRLRYLNGEISKQISDIF